MKGKVFLIIGIVILSLIILVGAFYFLIISGAIFSFGSNPPTPEITYGEFPFKLTYELNGETKIIEDTVICEFDGFYSLGSAGKYRKWKSHLKSGNERVTLLDLRPLGETNEFGQTMLELFFFYGNAEYYMDDELGGKKRAGGISTWVDYLYETADGTTGGSAFNADAAYEKYKINLISWEPSPPIQNNFK